MNYEYEYNRDRNKFCLYVNDALVYEFLYCDKMTDKEAEELADDLYQEYLDNKGSV